METMQADMDGGRVGAGRKPFTGELRCRTLPRLCKENSSLLRRELARVASQPNMNDFATSSMKIFLRTVLPAAVKPRSAAAWIGALCLALSAVAAEDDLLRIDNGAVSVGIDRAKGGSITWLSWREYPRNAVNIADPGRLIQQSYYAGKPIERLAEGQSKAWSPWTWNPIQGGGVGSWARVTEFKRTASNVLYSATVPKLWDMANEEARAQMRQWTSFEPGFSNVIVVRCEFESQREENDRWGPPVARHQEIPACYFTRNFAFVKSYLGDGKWRVETQPPGPPWGHARPPLKAMACFNEQGNGIGIFSPGASEPWNFGPHGTKITDEPAAAPCMHVAPLDSVALTPRSEYRYRYWLLTGTEAELAATLEKLWAKYSREQAVLQRPGG